MYKIFYSLLRIMWILDIINIPQLACLDTTYPINGLAWLLIWIFAPSTTAYINKDKE